jgi:hypothetical protein
LMHCVTHLSRFPCQRVVNSSPIRAIASTASPAR